jgi:hypothetical protein
VRTEISRVVVVVVAAASIALFVSACGHDIGDSCKTAADCDPNGTRTCDLSQPGGYCTMAGCDDKSCPSGAVCIRYFPENSIQMNDAKKTCNVDCEDIGGDDAGVGSVDAGADGGVCPQGPTNDCAADELCLNSGVCAKRSFETHACAYTCGGNGDCRGGYDCWPVASTGISEATMMSVAHSPGMMLLAQSPTAVAKVCAPKALAP